MFSRRVSFTRALLGALTLLGLSLLCHFCCNFSSDVEFLSAVQVKTPAEPYTRNLTLINTTIFKFNGEDRDFVRNSSATLRLVFLLGATTDRQLQESIGRENDEHHDIVQGEFLDIYRNLSYKNIMGKLWVSEFRQQVCLMIEEDPEVLISGAVRGEDKRRAIPGPDSECEAHRQGKGKQLLSDCIIPISTDF